MDMGREWREGGKGRRGEGESKTVRKPV